MRVVLVVDSQRNALYSFVLREMEDYGDIVILLRDGKVDQARELRERFEQDMRLLDQLGWERDRRREACAIRLPLDEIAVIFERLLAEATDVIGSTLRLPDETLEEAYTVAETAEMVLGALPGETA